LDEKQILARHENNIESSSAECLLRLTMKLQVLVEKSAEVATQRCLYPPLRLQHKTPPSGQGLVEYCY